MGEVVLLWFLCKNKNCDYIPLKTKKQKIERWKDGESITRDKKQRSFLRYVDGNRRYRNNGDKVIFDCKYGEIVIYDKNGRFNDYFNPITDKEMCNPCMQKIQNEGALFQ